MVVNPDKFQVILLDKRGPDNTNVELKIGNEKIKSTSSVELLGVHIDDKLNFNRHINKLCESAKCCSMTKVIHRSYRNSGFSQQFHILKFWLLPSCMDVLT